jgi:RNA polymerase sigma-70 factor (ECF subfamily)
MSDDDIDGGFERGADDDVERFRLVVQEHEGVVYRFLCCMVGGGDVARELAQETFYRAFKARDTFASRSAASTWLCGIARNVALNHLRSSGRYVSDEGIAERVSDAAPERELLAREQREAIRRALLALDEEKRVAFTLKVLEQKSYEEIAAITGSAVGKLRTDVHRARLQLRVALAEHREGTS